MSVPGPLVSWLEAHGEHELVGRWPYLANPEDAQAAMWLASKVLALLVPDWVVLEVPMVLERTDQRALLLRAVQPAVQVAALMAVDAGRGDVAFVLRERADELAIRVRTMYVALGEE